MSDNSISQVSLADFVRTTLDEIRYGLQGKSIAKNYINISFEIGITANKNETKDKSSVLGISVVSAFKAGIKKEIETTATNKAYNKLSFSVPLLIKRRDGFVAE
jgi:hypothetical protein